MPWIWSPREHVSLAKYVMRWVVLATPIGLAVGSACAMFLWSLEKVTAIRQAHPALLFFLPVAGAIVVLVYNWWGKGAGAGNNLIMDEIHEPGAGVPVRMAPFVLAGTLITHLFGGSAGREGTAVQMGGSIAAGMGRILKFQGADLRTLLMCGIAAGFAGVFGTPLTGAVFAMEVLVLGRMSYEAIIPCLIAAVVGDWSCQVWGIQHTHYAISSMDLHHQGIESSFHWLLAAKVAVASVAFGLASVFFAELTHGLAHAFGRIKLAWLRPVVGALVVIGLTYALGTREYLGLGVKPAHPGDVSIVTCFQANGADTWSWFWKLLFTAVTLSCGFKGGEVTPLFFIGAALGNTLAHWMNAPVDLFAGLGFVAIFAGATNTPLACTIMGLELFGSQYTVYFMIACFLSYLLSGHSGIYHAQRVGAGKLHGFHLPEGATIKTVREARRKSAGA